MTWSEFEVLPMSAQIALIFVFAVAFGFVGYAVNSWVAARLERKLARKRPAEWWEKYPVE